MAEPVIYREEITGLLFAIHDLNRRCGTSIACSWRKTMAGKKRTRAEIRAFRAEWEERNNRLLELAKKAQAELDRRKRAEG